ncbi:MAG: NADH-quinone oxidoreductase subunit NuoK [Thermoplasmataceae archaeon]
MDLFIVTSISMILFAIGLYGIMTSNIGIKMLISIEILINAAMLNLVAVAINFSSVAPLILALFVIAIAAAESVIGISLLTAIYRKYGKVSLSLLREIRW